MAFKNDDLIERAGTYLAQAAPHVRKREHCQIIEALIAALSPVLPDKCEWHDEEPDDYDFAGHYETSCGQSFNLNDGNLAENKIRFCCFCGKPVVETGGGYKDE